VDLAPARCQHHLQRTFAVYQKKIPQPVTWEAYLDHLYPLDWFLASACLEGFQVGPSGENPVQGRSRNRRGREERSSLIS
jgi:hypothetical protein